MSAAETNLMHGTCVAVGGAGVLLLGPSGSGKSDLALRLIDDGALLVADDQCMAEIDAAGICMSAPEAIAGRLEVRGVGIVGVNTAAQAHLALVVNLVTQEDESRMPKKGAPLPVQAILGQPVPCLDLWPFAASAPAKIRLALNGLQFGQIFNDTALS